MESNHLHHLQDQPPPPDEPSSYGVVGSSTHSWTPNITLNAGNFNQNLQEANQISRTLTHRNDIRVPQRPLNGSMIQDLGYQYHWTSTTDAERCLATNNHSSRELEFSKIKEEISVHDFPKFSEMLNRPSSMEGYQLIPCTTTSTTNNQMKNIEHEDMNADLNEKLLFKTLLSGDFYSSTSTSAQNYPNFGGTTSMPSRGNFSQIYPSINISNLNQSTTYNSTEISRSNLDMNTQSFDLLTTARSYSEGLSQHSQDHDALGRFPDNVSFHLHQMQLSNDRSSCGNSSTNPSHFTNGTAETKRPCTLMESKTSQSQTASKKSRLESRPSCPPFKVRKEKLGDRIAALQQLVAPFGKTDTASVLMEAIGYIKFLQGQVETLSVPYMKSSQNQTNRVMQGGSAIGDANGEPKQDLRSRGLCLVPLSCMSYIAGDGGNDVWQQPNFGGAT